MKKMNKMYEAPAAEMIEMQMPVVLANTTYGGSTGGGTTPPPGGGGGGAYS
jgi:hypothetical protein